MCHITSAWTEYGPEQNIARKKVMSHSTLAVHTVALDRLRKPIYDSATAITMCYDEDVKLESGGAHYLLAIRRELKRIL